MMVYEPFNLDKSRISITCTKPILFLSQDFIRLYRICHCLKLSMLFSQLGSMYHEALLNHDSFS